MKMQMVVRILREITTVQFFQLLNSLSAESASQSINTVCWNLCQSLLTNMECILLTVD